MEQAFQDLRVAVRTLVRQPGFAVLAVLTLGLGIGANTAFFGLVRAVLLRPLAFHEDHRLVRVYQVPRGGSSRISLRPQTFGEVRDRQRSFENVVAQRFTDLTLVTNDGPERVVGTGVSERRAATLGGAPVIGRSFAPDEERTGDVALIGHGLWQRRFGGDPGIIGTTLTLDGRPRTVVGVMPEGFAYPYRSEVWLPMDVMAASARTWGLNVQARLADGASLEQARGDLELISYALAAELPDGHRDTTLVPFPTREVLVGDGSRVALLLFAAVGFVLLIVCANVAGLLLARGLARQREVAVRAALGASAGHQIRLMLTETMLLAVAGGAVGVLIAWWGSAWLTDLAPGRLRDLMATVAVDRSVLFFAAAVSVATGLVFGLAPAIKASRVDLIGFLQGGGRTSGGRSSRRLWSALVVGEMALALVLLSGGGLMLRNLQGLQELELGYPAEGLTIFSIPLNRGQHTEAGQRVSFVARAEDRLRALPGVESAGTTCIYPSRRGNFLARVGVEGLPDDPSEQRLVNHRLVSPGFLATLGTRLIAGRGILDTDTAESQGVVVISRAMAERYWPGEDPIGRRVRNQRSGGESPWLDVVGVVSDVREFYEQGETWYLPYAQDAGSTFAGRATFVVRWRGAAPTTGTLRAAIAEIDPTLPVYDVTTPKTLYDETIAQKSYGTALLSGFAAFGALLAALGIYGVTSYSVGQRSRELGIRAALGATPADLLRNVMADAARLATMGLVLGIASALGLSRLIGHLLSEVGATDPVSYVLAASLLAGAALLAALLPALRAMRSDPAVVLRQE